jgi:hypothetical protein
MRTHIRLAILSCALLTVFSGVAVAHNHDPSPSGSPSPSASPSPSPSPTPACLAADLTAYGACVAACDTASSAVCSNEGSVDHFVAFLKSSLADCSYPNLSSERQINGLKSVIDGLRQSGALSFADSRIIRSEINVCRKALKHGHHHGHGHH